MKRYLSSSLFEQFEGFGDEISQIEPLALVVLYLVASVAVAVAEDVEDRQNLAVVGHQCLAYHIPRKHQLLDHFQHGGDYLGISGIESG